MDLSCSQSSQHVRLSMPLAKFSYANTPAGNIGPIPWIHLSSHSDLFVILDPYEIFTETGDRVRRYRFKVLQDPGVHEDFDLHLLACEAQKAIDEVQNAGVPGQQPFITVIVKTPCVAMRYPLQDKQIRRFQVRFAKEEDFYETLRIFASMKVPFVEAGAVPPVQTANTPSAVRPMPSATSNLQSGIRTSFEADKRVSAALHHNVVHQDPVSKGVPLHESSVNSGLHCAQDVLVTASLPVPQPEFMLPKRVIQPRLSESNLSYHTNQINHETGDVGCYNSRTRAGDNMHPLSTCISGPSTAPVATVGSLESTLPPKRNLPFERKTSSSKLGVQGHATNCRPVVFKEYMVTKAPELEHAARSAHPKGTDEANDGAKKKPTAKKARTTSRKKSAAARKSQEETAVPTVDELLQRRSNSPEARVVPTSTTEASHKPPQNFVNNINTQPNPAPSSGLTALLAHPDFTPQNPPRTSTQHIAPGSISATAKAAIHEFDSLSEEQRRAALETWIAQTLADDSFVRLCQTLEGLWQRVFVRF